MQMIGPDNFADEVLSADQPVLLLYMPCDDDFPSQSRLIEDITQRHKSWLKTGLLAEAFNEYFKNKLDVHGTPTFLIFLDGKEKNRMFGLADPESLDLFIRETLNHGAADH